MTGIEYKWRHGLLQCYTVLSSDFDRSSKKTSVQTPADKKLLTKLRVQILHNGIRWERGTRLLRSETVDQPRSST